MEAILSYLLKVSRVSICIVMEIEFLFSQKPANVTAKSLKNGGREGFRGFFPPFNLLTAPLYMNRNVILVYSKICLYLGDYIDVNNERI